MLKYQNVVGTALVLMVSLGGCVSGNGDPNIDSASALRGGVTGSNPHQKMHYDDRGRIFKLRFHYNERARTYHTLVQRTDKPFTGLEDDTLVKTALQDFYSRKICSTGHHGNVLNDGFGSFNAGGVVKYRANVKCVR